MNNMGKLWPLLTSALAQVMRHYLLTNLADAACRKLVRLDY